jgi:GntR family transcriptional regulator/MocR family aminotransferase
VAQLPAIRPAAQPAAPERQFSAQGLPELREAIAHHIAFARGVHCSAADVLVCNGAQQALDLIARVLVEPGCKVAMEDPGYPPARQLFLALGAQVQSVPVDDEGCAWNRSRPVPG